MTLAARAGSLGGRPLYSRCSANNRVILRSSFRQRRRRSCEIGPQSTGFDERNFNADQDHFPARDFGKSLHGARRPYEIGMACWQKGLYVRFVGDTLQLAPPFISEKGDIDRLVSIVDEAIKEASS
jgi:hypothetical protein